ncbi:terpene synthase metal-binding domain-containing protein, partial [Metarhizium majus ARSEF 297]|uniref:Sesquiterpene synthase MAJ_08936 n=1 Tax=Metarhizium majus (strain ARSEF 297) TaxID=1276143 RepID=BTPSL_METMF
MEKQRLKAQLSSLRVPLFSVPWPGQCSNKAEVIEARMMKWADEHNLLVTDEYRNRVIRTRYGLLAARCYPNAGEVLLQAIADYLVWFFLADDLFVDRVEVATDETIRNLTAMVDVLDLNVAGSPPVFGELAWLDVCQRLRRLLQAEAFERFAQGMRLWATTAALQILNHLRPTPVGIREYQTIRRHTSGLNPCTSLADAANKGSVQACEFYDADVQTLVRQTNNIVCWANDIQSLRIEIHQPGQFRNMVTIYAQQGQSLQDAVETTATRVNKEIAGFCELADAVTARPISDELHGLIDGLEYWIRGYLDWVVHDTMRYADQFIESDADDRRFSAPDLSLLKKNCSSVTESTSSLV